MDIDGDGVPFAVGGGEFLQRSRNDLRPVFLGRERGDVAKLARFRVVDREIAEDLRGRRRIAGGHHRLQRRHCAFAATACDGNVLPGVAFFCEILLENVQGGCFAARRPPVQHLDFLDVGRRGPAGKADRRGGHRACHQYGAELHCLPSKSLLPPETVRPRIQKPCIGSRFLLSITRRAGATSSSAGPYGRETSSPRYSPSPRFAPAPGRCRTDGSRRTAAPAYRP